MGKRHTFTTACTWDCPDACSLIIEESGGKPRIRGHPEHPVTQGATCGKIQRHLKRLSSPQRLTAPLLQTGAGWKEISWQEGLDICADKLGPLLEEDPEGMLHIQGQGARGIVKCVADRFFSSLGCTKTHGSLCDETGIRASILDFGSLEHNTVHELLEARFIVNWGKDLQRSAMHLGRLVNEARARGTRHIAVWPGGKGYERSADELIRIRPGTDRFLALAVLKELEAIGYLDQSTLEGCAGSKAFLEILEAWSSTDLAAVCDVSRESVRSLAKIYAGERVSSLIGWGLQRHPFGGEAVRLINALSWLSRNVGRPGSGVFFNLSSQRFFNLSWLPPEPGNRSLNLPRIGREIEAAASPPLRAAWLNGTNIVNQAPESRRLASLFAGLDFVVAVDGFMTDTAACADLVLPCCLMWEEEDVVGSSMHDCLQYAARVFSPPPNVRSDYWIAEELGRRLGSAFVFPSRERCFRRTLGAPFPDVDLDALQRQGFVHLEREPVVFSKGTSHPDGRFHLLDRVSPEPEPDPDYPLRLLSLIRRDAIHSQLLPEEHQLPPQLAVHPRASGLRRIDLDRPVMLVSPLGRLEVDLIFDTSLHPEAVIYRRGDWMRLGGGVNQLIEARLTDLEVGAAYYGQRVRLENA
jgi:anaerobic selenocysteine-containing dehydrogenase